MTERARTPSDLSISPNSGLWLLSVHEWERRQQGPTRRAIRAFDVRDESLRRLAGGAGQIWTDGRVVLKPVGCVPEHNWVCETFTAWDGSEVRVPEPVAPFDTHDADWSVDGWGAHAYVAGRDLDLDRELQVVRHASDAFHDSLKDEPRPAFMDARNDPWAFGDRLAWESAVPEGDGETLTLIRRLTDHKAPLTCSAQPIHGDILPNVLVADGRPPAVIDWPPYFRPVAMANAIAATDAVTFRGAPMTILDEWSTGEDWDQLLVRALLYRLGPTGIFAARNRLMGSLVTHVERVRPVVDAVATRF